MANVPRIIPAITSRDVAAAEALYCGILGLEVAMRDEDSGFRMLRSPSNPSAQLVINDDGAVALPPGLVIDVGEAGEVDRVHASVSGMGLPVVDALSTRDWGIRRFSFVDTQGVCVTVVAHESPAERSPEAN
ncbi:glyoxalase [Leucobacter sp. OAMLP11]|uniref:glyoxalase n=1 Tax=unclassified Leucobacter TaxID=2621730 RepID=UPI000C1818B2|nr:MULTISPECIES: glyoxalase [unclassified Leucobacter]PIO49631.1 glyoxalase [Leucobacter sp. OAMLP11]